MHSIAIIALLAAAALCAADVSHLSLSGGYLPPLSGGVGGYSGYNGYSSYPTYSSAGYYSGAGLSAGYGAPLLSGGYNSYNNYNSYAAVPQYNNYVTPSRAYLPAYNSGGYRGTKYGANGGYIY
ncbi:pupal cuticle protein Edg-91 [Drosophila busckii]|uniref:pupal cuticle protein Edg-91 n=1 Tax=Drosophila busckii TaxID=30019 RepID=UPI00083F289B|nr:pupal cuticle protein Edg-91 [Drosophila busckii]